MSAVPAVGSAGEDEPSPANKTPYLAAPHCPSQDDWTESVHAPLAQSNNLVVDVARADGVSGV